LSLNGSKIYGPKGTGLLLVKNNITLKPIQFGGGQENGLRSGTENVSGAVGLSVALENAELLRKKEAKRLTELRNYAINEILKIKNATLNGHSKKRLPNNINISFKDIDGEKLVIYLDDAGISASTGSACTEKSLESSHVITALGKNKNTALFAVRFTLGRETTKKELDTLIKILKNTIKKIQSL
jgi:cysteine desulfurase